MMNTSYPLDYNQQELLQCYRLDIFNIFNETMINRHINTDDSFNQKPFISNNIQALQPCEAYVYDRSKYKSTTTSEVNIYIFFLLKIINLNYY